MTDGARIGCERLKSKIMNAADAAAFIDVANRVGDFLAAHLHIVVGADADGGDRALRADDMLHRGHHFFGQPAVGHKDHSKERQGFVGGHGMRDPY